MAIEKECHHFNQCGFVKFLRSEVNLQARKLESDCGIEVIECGRASGFRELKTPLPETREELESAFPERYTDNTGRKRRIP